MTLRTRTVLFGAYCLVLFLGDWEILRAIVHYSGENASASHIPLVPVVTLVLVYQTRKRIFSSVESSWFPGLAVILAGAGLLAVGRMGGASEPGGTPTLGAAALVLLCLGGFLAFYGRRPFWAALFPLLFLGFAIPFPQPVIEGATQILKLGSTEAVAGLLNLTGTVHHRQGNVFTLPGFTIEVADECSGIRSTTALLLTSLLAGHLFLGSMWTKSLLVLVVVPITILKNGIRIVSLSLLAMHVDPSFLTGQLHREGGIVFFLLALAILAPFLAILRRRDCGRGTQGDVQ